MRTPPLALAAAALITAAGIGSAAADESADEIRNNSNLPHPPSWTPELAKLGKVLRTADGKVIPNKIGGEYPCTADDPPPLMFRPSGPLSTHHSILLTHLGRQFADEEIFSQCDGVIDPEDTEDEQ